MGQEKTDAKMVSHTKSLKERATNADIDDFVLEKNIFSNIFEKDIRRVFIYKKSERLAKAIQLITPAFVDSMSLKNRMEGISIGLVDAGILPPGAARTALSRELLALSSVLSIAQAGGLLSEMNARLISREAQLLLQEIAAYEEPQLFLEEAPTLAAIAKTASAKKDRSIPARARKEKTEVSSSDNQSKGHIKDVSAIADVPAIKDRREAILSVIRNKREASIKDISTVVRSVSEKTIQRELAALIQAGLVKKRGERRWSTYSLAQP